MVEEQKALHGPYNKAEKLMSRGLTRFVDDPVYGNRPGDMPPACG